ncbi:hypothetical protein HIM_07749 [Hirsutella minnesotensis 3608]|uniref:JmjC domain-containing protein n=1 Tax=Hirsutella minnesotensis 3608 TaxID=1043627 RepID=A0A0F7ZMY4_9HYPO|nr:hypothetical protein HIM_07749 [Hirsutella minnesotensis 3608]
MYSKYEEMVRLLLRELQTTPFENSDNTRWHRNAELLQKMFPAESAINFARTGSISGLNDDVDVFYTTENEISCLFDKDGTLQMPTVIKSGQMRRTGGDIDEFLGVLSDRFRNRKVDVQDFSTTDKLPVQMRVEEVIDKIRDSSSLSSGRLPINLLNLKCLGQASHAPAFLNRRRFGLIPAINCRLEAELAGEETAGKQNRATIINGREVDLAGSMTFSLFAERGSFTGFHVDNPDGTWVCSLWGRKVWIFASKSDQFDTSKFEAEGDEWIPESVRITVLEPGDILIMPPGKIVPHAVLTLEDSHMVGGMFMDTHCILSSVEKLLWIVGHPMVTNEGIPLQLIRGWNHLRDLFLEMEPSSADRAKFDELSERVRKALSCPCTGPCGTKCLKCKCALSASQDGKCTQWCHLSRSKKARR